MTKTNTTYWLIAAFSILLTITQTNAQVNCTSATPSFPVDLSSSPTATWVSPNVKRDGACCNPPDNNCVEFVITLHPDALSINFQILSGAIPGGSMFYQVNCGPATAVGDPICISGAGPHIITFCKPGNNPNTYGITSYSAPSFGPDINSNEGCNGLLYANFYNESSVTWNSISPGAPGLYNGNLSCTAGCDTTYFTNTGGMPSPITYKVCGNDINGCYPDTICGLISVTPIDAPQVSLAADTLIVCNPNTSTWIIPTISNNEPFSVQWSNGSTADSIYAGPGWHYLTVEDTAGCSTYQDSVFVAVETIITSVEAGNDHLLCGPTAVALSGTVTNGHTPVWTGGSGTFSTPNSTNTNYTPSQADVNAGEIWLYLSASSPNICPGDMDSLKISFTSWQGIPITVTQDISCFGANDGTASTTVSNGTNGPFTYSLNGAPASTTNSFSNLGPGTYSLQVINSLGCDTTVSFIINEPALLTVTNAGITNVSCFGGSDGSVSVTAAGGTAPYSYNWGAGYPNAATISSLTAGTYTVVVTDANGCTETLTLTVTEPTDLVVTNAGVTHVSCFGAADGSVSVTASGGTAPYSYNWGGTYPNAATLTGLSGGSYTVIVTDANGCTETLTLTVNEPTALALTKALVTNVSCNGGSDGSVTVAASGGTAPYTYNWGAGYPTTASLTGLTAGTYTVTVTDANGCTETLTFNVTEPTVLIVTNAGVTNVSCNGGSDGSVSVTVSGGTTAYTYNWGAGYPNSPSLTGLTAGAYTVVVTDANGCTETLTLTVTEPALLVVTNAGVTNVSCNGGSDGSVSVTVSGGTAPYSYNWGGTYPNAATLTGLSAGSYTVNVTDANGCTETLTLTVTEPAILAVTNAGVTNVSCQGGSDGSVSVSVTGGTAPYSYNWGASYPNAATLTGLSAGTYTVVVTDAKGCTETLTLTVTEPTDLVVTNAGVTNVSCNGGSDGSVSVSVSGGAWPYTYDWGAGHPNTSSLSGIPAGSYTVVVTDANGCTETLTLTVTEPTSLVVTNAGVTNVSCNGGSDGSVSVTVSGGTAPYSYNWGGTYPNAATLTGLTAGNYTVTVTDANGCTETLTLTVTEPAVLAVTNAGVTNVSCFGGSDGSVSVSVTGGTAPYSYNWGGTYPNAATLTGLSAGSYTVTVTDANGCAETLTLTVTEPAVLAVNNAGVTNVSCNGGSDGSVSVSVSGGTAPYSYNWGGTYPNSATLTGLSAGSYTVTVTDANGCTETLTLTVTEPTPLAVTNAGVTNVSCNGGSDGSVSVSVSGGTAPYSYNWGGTYPNAATLTGLTASSYTVVVTDANGCTGTLTLTVTEPTVLVVTNAGVTNVSCNGGSDGSVSVTASGGTAPYSYNWGAGYPNASTISGLTAGSYTVVVTDANGCTETLTLTVTEPAVLVVTNAGVTNVSCFGGSNGSVSVSVSGGTAAYSYNWGASYPNAATLTGLPAGSYTVVVTDANGCTETLTLTVTEPADLVVTNAGVTNVSCNGGSDGSVSVTVTGGTAPYSYNWGAGHPNAASLTGLTAGSYTVVVTDANGCTETLTLTVTEPTTLVVTNAGVTNVSCNGGSDGSVSVTASGGTAPYSYNWGGTYPNAATLTGLTAGTYTVTVTDANGCTETLTLTVTEPTVLAVTNAGVTNVSCFGGSDGSVSVSVTGGTAPYSYNWGGTYPNAATLNGLSAGSYTVTVTDANGCTETLTLTVTEPTVLAVTNAGVTNVSCNGGSDGSVSVSVTGGTWPYSYNWGASYPNASTLTGLSAGSYTVVVTDANGCTETLTLTVTEAATLTVTNAGITHVSCNGGSDGSVSVTAGGGTAPYTYNWGGTYPNAATLTGLSAGSYTVVVTDANGCAETLTLSVTEPPVLTVSNAGVTNVSCFGGSDGSVSVSVTGGTASYVYDWGGTYPNTASLTGLTAGSYTVVVTDAKGCTETLTLTVTEPADLVVTNAGVTHVSCFGGSNGSVSVSVSGGIAPYSYNWGGSYPNTSSLSGLSAGTYTVVVTDANGCTETLSLTVNEAGDLVVANAGVTNVSCNGGSDGSVSVTVSGGTFPYTYDWGAGYPNASTISALSAGSYSVLVTDGNGCTQTLTLTVTQPNDLVITNAGITNVSCNGGSDGSVSVNVSGGTAPYTYNWGPGKPNSATLTGLTAGTYSVTVVDSKGCSESLSLTVTEPTVLAVTNAGITNVSCNGGSDGSVSVTATGGTAPYSYNWGTGYPNAATISGLTAGSYTVLVTDANGCTETLTLTVTEPSGMVVSNGGSTNITCFGGADGSATVTVTGGTTPYSYNWGAGYPNAATIAGLTAGSYTVVVTDVNGCTGTGSVSFTLTEPTDLVVTNAGITHVSCNGGADGSVSVSVSGGIAPYTYNWGAGYPTTSSLSGLSAGSYTVVVTDANGCTETLTLTVTEPNTLLVANGGVSNVTCFGGADGSVTASVSGGIPPYSFNWGGTYPNSATLTGLAAGTYTVIVSDANGCSTSSLTLTVTQPNDLVVTNAGVTDASCNGGADGTASVTVSGGVAPYSYNWGGSHPNSATITGLTAGSYIVMVTDANGCTESLTVIVSEASSLSVSNGGVTHVTCNGGSDGSVTVNATGGTPPYSYNWGGTHPNAATLTGLTAGTYSVIVSDANNCSATTLTFTVTEPTDLVVTNAGVSNVSCNGASDGTVSVNVSGGNAPYSYNWGGSHPNSPTLTGLTPGSYTVVVTDASGCTETLTLTVTEPTDLAVTNAGVTNVSCHGASDGSVSVTASGGTAPYSYNWGGTYPNASSLTGIPAGSYTVVVTDANGCTETLTLTVTEPADLVVTNAGVTNASCNGGSNGSASVSVTGGVGPYSYNWGGSHPNSATITGLTAGNYTVVVTDAGGCTETLTLTVGQATTLAVANAGITHVTCNGGSNGAVSVNATGGTPPYTYNWGGTHPNSASLSGLTAGSYTVVVTDANGCTATVTSTVTEPADLVVTNAGITHVSCDGGSDGSVSVTVSGGIAPYSYNWGGTYPNSNSITGLAAGSYTVIVTDDNGCTETLTLTVTEPSDLTVTNAGITNVSCFGGSDGSVSVTAAGGTAPYSYNWGGTYPNASSISGLSAGSYSVIVTDAKGCTETLTLTVTEPTVLAVSNAGVTNVSCEGGSDGSVAVTASGGTAPYSYNWGGTYPNAASLTGLSSGSYTVVVTDAKGCTETLTLTVTEPSDLAVANAGITNVSCNGGSDGSVSVTASGGTAPYSYNWGGTHPNSATLTGLTPGTYTVVVTDAKGCTETLSLTVTEPAVLAVSNAGVSNVSCFGGSDGSVSVSVTGGTAPYSFNWGAGYPNSSSLTGLTAGSYTVVVTDANGCTETLTLTITEPSVLAVSNAGITHVSCFGASDGSVSVSVSGGTAPYFYNWGGSYPQASSISSLSGGAYTVTVTDANGCTQTLTLTVNEPTEVLVTNAGVTNVSCNGGSDGSVSVSVSGGSSPYTYYWGSGYPDSPTITGLSAGSYTVLVTDANGCMKSLTLTVTESAVLSVSNASTTTDVSCQGGSDGTASVDVSGGTAPFSYNWGAGYPNAATITGLSAGSYSVVVTDANGCTENLTVVINEPTDLVVTNAGVTNVSCFGGSDGSVSVTASGGTAPYSYNWGASYPNSATLTGLPAGSYTVIVTDANGCTETLTLTVTEPTDLAVTNAGITHVSCFGGSNGSVSVSASGGTWPYTYNWGGSYPNAASINGLGAGNYTVIVTDANGCTETLTLTVNEPTDLVVTNAGVTNVSCFGGSDGSVSVTASGGTAPYTYNWGTAYPASATITGLTAGSYSVVVTDANGCTETLTLTVTEPAVLAVANAGVTNVSCFGGSDGAVSVSVSGGTAPYSYNWGAGYPNSSSISGLSAGSYTVVVTDANGCTETLTLTVNESTDLVVTNAGVTNVSCFGAADGSVSVTASGGTAPYSYNWGAGYPNSATLTGLSGGSYTVVVTDANGCTETLTLTVTEPADLVVTNAGVTNVSCNGGSDGSVSVSVSGGVSPFNYNWGTGYPNSATLTGLSAGSYTVLVTDANGCTESLTLTVTESAVLSVSNASTTTDVSCQGGSDGTASVDVTGGATPYSYNWGAGYPNAATITGLAAGSYSVVVTDANGCTENLTVVINEPTDLVVTNAGVTNVSCFGGSDGSVSVTASGGKAPYSYNWGASFPNSASLTGLPAGSYTVIVTDANGCTETLTLTVTEPAVLAVANAGVTNVSCNGGSDGSVSVTASGGTWPYSYNWGGTYPNAASINGLAAGNYTVIVTDANGCTETLTLTVNEPTDLVVTNAGVTNVSCFGGSDGSVSVTASGGTAPYTYNWGTAYPASATITGLTAGSYSVVVTDANGCTETLTLTVTEPAILAIANAGVTNVSCFGGSDGAVSVSVSGGTAPYSYNWGAGYPNSATITGLSAGSYTVVVTDANGCSSTLTLTVTEPSDLAVSISAISHVNCNGGSDGSISVTPTGGTPAYSYNWGAGYPNSSTINGLSAGTYSVIVTDSKGCTTSISATITQSSALVAANGGTTNVSCFGGSDGSASVSVSGGTSPYSYNWGTSYPNASTITGLTAGNYTVVITDANGCAQSMSFTITQPSDVLVSNAGVTNVSCFGGSNGSVGVNVTGGTAPYSYDWGAGYPSSSMISNLSAGSYTVVVTDANGCTKSLTLTVTEPNALSNAFNNPTISCFGQSTTITSTVSGGTPPYTYQWNGQAGSNSYTTTAGTHSLFITDANGCNLSASITVTEPNQLGIILPADQTVCDGSMQTINSTVSGGTAPYNYTWSHDNSQNGATATAVISNSMTIVGTVIDNNGCFAVDTIKYTMVMPQSISISPDTILLCPGNVQTWVNSQVSNPGNFPYNIMWSSGATADSAYLGFGQHYVTVSDTYGCSSASDSVYIQQQTIIATSEAGPDIIVCNPNSIQLSASYTNGQSTAWSGGNGFFSDFTSPTASYTPTQAEINGGTMYLKFFVQSYNNCSNAIDSVKLTFAQFIGNISVNKQDINCNGNDNGIAQVIVTGGTYNPYTYSFDGAPASPNNTASNLTPGTHTVVITNTLGCDSLITFVINEPAQLSASIDFVNDALCFGGDDGSLGIIVVGGTAPYSYNWGGTLPNSANLNNLLAGTYNCTITDQRGCTTTISVTIDEPSQMNNAFNTTPILCFGGSTQVNTSVSGGTSPYSYVWNGANGTNTFDAIAGNHALQVYDANGCILAMNISVTEPTEIIASLPSNFTVCEDENVTLQATVSGGTPGYNFHWPHDPFNYTNSSSVNVVSDTTYDLTVQDNNGCSVVISSIISTHKTNASDFNIVASSEELCEGDTVSLDYTYTGESPMTKVEWIDCLSCPFPRIVSPDSNQVYYALLINECGDTLVDSVNLIVYNEPEWYISPNEVYICPNIPVQFQLDSGNVPADYMFFWDIGGIFTSNLAEPIVAFPNSGFFQVSVTVSNPFGCMFSSSNSADVTVYPQPKAGFNASAYVKDILSPTVNFFNTSISADLFNWTFGDGDTSIAINPSHTFKEAGTFPVTLFAENQYGCKDSITKYITLKPDYTLYVPNTFTPQGDKHNQIFKPVYNELNKQGFLMQIYDRWGHVLYETQDPDEGWDGINMNTGLITPVGTYTWVIYYNDFENTQHRMVGHVNLIR